MFDSHEAKGKIQGQVYLLHFDIGPGVVIPSIREDATKPFHARHYLGFAEDAKRRIQEHQENGGNFNSSKGDQKN